VGLPTGKLQHLTALGSDVEVPEDGDPRYNLTTVTKIELVALQQPSGFIPEEKAFQRPLNIGVAQFVNTVAITFELHK
jgi:hypothetical protein